jgi:hypothetical protein
MATLTKDVNGFIEIKDNKLSRGGVFDYLGSEIGAPEPERIYQVFRPPEELADAECIESFRLQPWIIDHKMLGKYYDSPPEAKGIHGTIGENVYFDESDGWLKGNIKIWSDMLEEEIDEGKNELSLGYRCVYEFEQIGTYEGKRYNVVQRRIRGNHLASVDASRTDVAVMDSVAMDMKITIDTKRAKLMDKKPNPIADAVKKANATPENVVKKEGDATDQDMTISELSGMIKEIMPQIAEISKVMGALGKMATGEPEADGGAYDQPEENGGLIPDDEPDDNGGTEVEIEVEDEDKPKEENAMDNKLEQTITAAVNKAFKPLADKVDKLEKVGATAFDSKSFLKEVDERNSLAVKVSRFVGTFDHSAMTLQEVAKYGVDKLEVPATEGRELDALRAYLHGREPKGNPALFSVAQDSAAKSENPIANYVNGDKK